MPPQPRLVYPTQPMQIEPIISTQPILTMEQHIQPQPVVSQPMQINSAALQPQVSSQ